MTIIKEIIKPKENLSDSSKNNLYHNFFAKFNPILHQTIKCYNDILYSNPNLLKDDFLISMGLKNNNNSNSKNKNKKNQILNINQIANLSTQASYLILNKIFSYYVIQTRIHKHYGIKIPNLFDSTQNFSLESQIRKNFEDLINTFEFAPIFQTDLFTEKFHFSNNLSSILQKANNLFLNLHLEQLNDDIISDLYQNLIPIEEKKKLGQIYTPIEIADIMVKLVLRDPDDVVLDPACGCGTLLRRVYNQLYELKSDTHQSTNHAELLSQIWGIEINAFPAQLAMMSLAFTDLSAITEVAGIIMEDFLDIDPLEKYYIKTKNLKTGKIITREMPQKFDVIIANPPYIKQELIPNKKDMIKKLPLYASYRSKLKYSDCQKKIIPNIKLELTGKTDYYGFFLWYSTYFLKNKGRLCFIIPNKWMDVEYGRKIKEFLFQNYKIISIIGFNKNVFKNAQVSTIILIAQKEEDSFKRNHHYVKFINILEKSGREKLETLVKTTIGPIAKAKINKEGYIFYCEDPSIHYTLIKQDHLKITEKWSHKYIFQSQFARILSKVSLISMNNCEITSVVGGIKTGANDFFFPSIENQIKFSIEPQFLIPGIKNGRNIPPEFIITKSKNKFLAVSSDINVLNYPGLYSYIQDGKINKKYSNRRSVHWKPWFSIPPNKRDSPDLLFLRHINRNFRIRWNKIQCIVADGVRGIKIFNPNHIQFYLGVCNSTFFYWQAHIYGRWEGQGDLQLLVYELRQFQLPDIRTLSKIKIKNVEKIITQIIDEGESSPEQNSISPQLQKELDLAVLKCLNMKNYYDLLIEETYSLEQHRLTKGL